MKGATCHPPLYRDPEVSTDLLPEYPVAPAPPVREVIFKEPEIYVEKMARTIEIAPE